jgi:hypothetical protein
MAGRGRTLRERISDRLRRLDSRLHINHGRRSEWFWVIPLAGFAVTAAILIVAGAMTGVWAAEYIPTALIEGLVIAGLFLACLSPDAAPADGGPGDRGPDTEPSPAPPQFDPTVWVALLADSDVDAVRSDVDDYARRPVTVTSSSSLN